MFVETKREGESQAKSKPAPFTTASLIAWLEQQPADGAYDWHDIKNCLACHYFKAMGHKRPWATSKKDGWYSGPFGSVALYQEVGATEPWTYGAALERLQAALKTADPQT